MKDFTRRSFLQGLIALGAAYVLPENANPAQVNTVWNQALETPWFFEVNDSNTIVDSSVSSPETWSDVYDISLAWIKTPTDLISEVGMCEPLRNRFCGLADNEVDALRHQLDDDDLSKKESKALQAKIDAWDYDEGWEQWVLDEGPKRLDEFKEVIADWLTESVDWQYSDWILEEYSPQGQAKAFFESLGVQTCRELGVVIIEGEHPGSTYYAAELRQDIDTANEAAVNLGLPIRFRPEA